MKLTEEIIKKEGYKDVKFLAKFFGRSDRHIRKLTTDGIIKGYMFKGAYYYELIPTIQSYISYLQEKADAILSEGSLEKELLEADVRLAKARAKKAEVEAKQLEESLLPTRDVKLFVEHILMTFKKTFLNLPEKVTNNLLAKNIICQKDKENNMELIKELNEEMITQIINKFKFDINFYKEHLQEDKKLEFFDEEDEDLF